MSLPNHDPIIGSLEIVIVNDTDQSIEVKEVEFRIPIGPIGDVLTPTTADIQHAVSDSTKWRVKPPDGPITSGTAKYYVGTQVAH